MQLADAGRGHLNLRVLNLSLAVPADDPAVAPLTEAVERLWADGITVVAAAGNGGGGVDAPGIDPYVVTVGATTGAHPDWSPDQVKAALVTTGRPLGAGQAALDLKAALGLASVAPANGDLLPLLAAGRAPAGLQARALPAIRWVARHWAARHWAARGWATARP